MPKINDNKIIISAFYCGYKVTFVTNDLSCRAAAREIGLETLFLFDEDDDTYTGYKEVVLSEEEMAEFYESFAMRENKYDLLNNQYI